MSDEQPPRAKKGSIMPPIDPVDMDLAEHEAEFTFVGVFDDHDDGAMRIAHMAQTSQQKAANAGVPIPVFPPQPPTPTHQSILPAHAKPSSVTLPPPYARL